MTELRAGGEVFELSETSSGIDLVGDGPLRRLVVDLPGPWRRVASDDPGVTLLHPDGGRARVSARGGLRLRVDVMIDTESAARLPGPELRVASEHPPLSWLGGASGEVALVGVERPGLLRQVRGNSAPSEDPARWFPLGEEVELGAGQVASAGWVYERFEGDAWSVPPEPAWLPPERFVPRDEYVEFVLPDGRLETYLRNEETEDGFRVYPLLQPCAVEVWGAGGCTSVPLGGYLEAPELRALRAEHWPSESPEEIYVAARSLLDRQPHSEDVDWVDGQLLARGEGAPSPWWVAVAGVLGRLGRPRQELMARIAERLLATPTLDDVLILALNGLHPRDLGVGRWPAGDLEAEGRAAMRRLGYGRIRNCGYEPTGRDTAFAWFYLIGLGESELGLRLSAHLEAAKRELLCRLDYAPDGPDLAWLSLIEAGG